MTLRCKLLGHKFTYSERTRERDGEPVVDAECIRSGCDYEKELDREWLEAMNRTENA